MSSNLSDRLMILIEYTTAKHRRFKQMEEITGIDADRWTAYANGRQRPNFEMIEAAGKANPNLCLWLVTGDTDFKNEQYDPATFAAMKKHKLKELREKEPMDLTDEEMLVINASYPDPLSDAYKEFVLIIEARAKKKLKSEILAEWYGSFTQKSS